MATVSTTHQSKPHAYVIKVVSDEGRILPNGAPAEKVREYTFPTLDEARKSFNQFTDWGLATWERTVTLSDKNGTLIETKRFTAPHAPIQ